MLIFLCVCVSNIDFIFDYTDQAQIYSVHMHDSFPNFLENVKELWNGKFPVYDSFPKLSGKCEFIPLRPSTVGCPPKEPLPPFCLQIRTLHAPSIPSQGNACPFLPFLLTTQSSFSFFLTFSLVRPANVAEGEMKSPAV